MSCSALAPQAQQFGLANRVVPDGQAVPEAGKLARRLGDLPPQALRETRRVLNQRRYDQDQEGSRFSRKAAMASPESL